MYNKFIMKNFKIRDTFSLAWEDLKKNWGFMIGALLVFILVGFLDGMFGVHQNEITKEVTGSGLFSIILQIVEIYLTAGFIMETIKIVDGKKSCLKTMFTWPVNFIHGLKYFGAYIIYALLIFIPVILIFLYAFSSGKINDIIGNNTVASSLIALGVVALLLTMFIGMFIGFAYYLIIENRNGIFSNIKKSFEMVKNNFWKVLVWYLIIFGILALVGVVAGILSMIHPVAILIFTVLLIPAILIFAAWMLISYAHLYRKIDPEVEEVVKIEEKERGENIEA